VCGKKKVKVPQKTDKRKGANTWDERLTPNLKGGKVGMDVSTKRENRTRGGLEKAQRPMKGNPQYRQLQGNGGGGGKTNFTAGVYLKINNHRRQGERPGSERTEKNGGGRRAGRACGKPRETEIRKPG